MTRSKATSPFRASHLLSKPPALVGALPELLGSVVGSAFNRGQFVIHCHEPRAFLAGIRAAWLSRHRLALQYIVNGMGLLLAKQ